MSVHQASHPLIELILSLNQRLAQEPLNRKLIEPLAAEMARSSGAYRVRVRLALATPGRVESLCSEYRTTSRAVVSSRFVLPVRAGGEAYGSLVMEFASRVPDPRVVILAAETLAQMLANSVRRARPAPARTEERRPAPGQPVRSRRVLRKIA